VPYISYFYLNLTDFQNFPGPVALFQDFPVLENATVKFQDFPGFQGPVRTLLFDDVDDKEYSWKTLMSGIVDECFPLKKMRVRSKDVPYMTTSWKNAIRAKRNAAIKYHKDKSAENWETNKRCRNETTRQRRLTIRQYWTKKTNDLKSNPRDFFRTFKPFLGSKSYNGKDAEINLKVNNTTVRDQATVAETLAIHFASLADNIGNDKAKRLSEIDPSYHQVSARLVQNSIKSKQLLLN